MNSRIENAYRDWLGIDSPTPTHYQLLGIHTFETNMQAIVAACGSRTNQISLHLGGPDADVASRVLSDLAAAKACLLDAQAKAKYDAWLNHQPPSHSTTPPHASPTGYHRPAPRDETGIAPAYAPAARVAATGAVASATIAQHKFDPRRSAGSRIDEPKSALPWLIGGVCAGLLGVCVLAMVLFGMRDRNNTADNETSSGQPLVARDQGANSGDRSRGNDTRAPRSRTSKSEQVAPPSNSADRLAWDREPVLADGDVLDVDALENPETSASVDKPAPAPETPTDKPVLRLADVPRAVALPKRKPNEIASIAPVVLTRVNVEDVNDVNLQLVAGPPAGGSGHFELTPRDATGASSKTWDVQHVVDGTAPSAVGQYTLADGELTFAWSPDADPQTQQQLENQPLKITAGEEVATLAQRQAEHAQPIVVKVDAGAVGATVSIDNPPQSADIVVAIDDLGEEFGEYTWEPSNAIEVGKSTTLRFGAEQDAFQLALEVSAEEAGPNRVRIEARPMFRSLGTKRWDFFRPKQAAETLVALQQQQGILDAQMQDIQRLYRRDPAARDQATAIHNQQSALLLERIANLERISDRCLELQDKAELHFRIYADTGETEIELLSTQQDSSAAAPAAEDGPMTRDANIGAPIEPAVDPLPDPPADPAPAIP